MKTVPGREHHHHQYRSPPPLSRITQWDMANFHHTTPNMENATVPQRHGPKQSQQASSSYHGSQSCPSSGYPALSETCYHPSQVMTSAQRSTIEHTPPGGTNTGPYHPMVSHLPITLYIHQGILYLLGLVLPLGMVILLEVHLDLILSTHSTLMIHDHLMPFPR